MKRYRDLTGDRLFFCIDSCGDITHHNTPEEAIQEAEKAIDAERIMCDPEWGEEVNSICWGEILGQAVEYEVGGEDEEGNPYVSYRVSDNRPPTLTTAEITAAERVKFEAWVKEYSVTTDMIQRDQGGGYAIILAHWSWKAWCEAVGCDPMADVTTD